MVNMFALASESYGQGPLAVEVLTTASTAFTIGWLGTPHSKQTPRPNQPLLPSKLASHHFGLLTPGLPLTTHHSPLTSHHSPFTTHHSPLITHRSPLTSHRSPLITHHAPLTTHHATVFAVELALKLVFLGPIEFFDRGKNLMNCLDLVIVTSSIVELIIPYIQVPTHSCMRPPASLRAFSPFAFPPNWPTHPPLSPPFRRCCCLPACPTARLRVRAPSCDLHSVYNALINQNETSEDGSGSTWVAARVIRLIRLIRLVKIARVSKRWDAFMRVINLLIETTTKVPDQFSLYQRL